MRISRYRMLRPALLAITFVAAVAAMPAKTAKVTLQTVTFKTALPAYVEITPDISGGLAFDVYMSNGACTQTPAANPGYAKLVYYTQLPYEVQLTQYGTFCFWVDAWDEDTGTLLPATVYTTVTISAKAAK